MERLIERWPRLQIVRGLVKRYRFHHWELEFADVFATNGGFDLVLGNPPWVKIRWEEAGILGDLDPSFVLFDLSSYSGSQTVSQVVIDDTWPGGPREKTIVYQAPWTRCNREMDYDEVWAHFAGRFWRGAS